MDILAIMGIIALLATMIAVFIWWLVHSGKWAWMRQVSAKRNIPVKAMIHCEDGYTRYMNLDNMPLCAQTKKRKIGFHNIAEMLITGPDNVARLPVHERYAIPLDYFGILTAEDIEALSETDKIATEAGDRMEGDQAAKDAQHTLATAISIMAGCIVLVFLVMAIFRYWGGGDEVVMLPTLLCAITLVGRLGKRILHPGGTTLCKVFYTDANGHRRFKVEHIELPKNMDIGNSETFDTFGGSIRKVVEVLEVKDGDNISYTPCVFKREELQKSPSSTVLYDAANPPNAVGAIWSALGTNLQKVQIGVMAMVGVALCILIYAFANKGGTV